MYQVIKRDGHAAEFNISRISSAIMKAFDATGIPYNSDVIDLLSLQVTADYAGTTGSVWRPFRTVWRPFCSGRATRRWPRPIFSTARTGKSCGI